MNQKTTREKPTYHVYTTRFEAYMHKVIADILSRFPRLSHEAIAQLTGIPVELVRKWVEIHE